MSEGGRERESERERDGEVVDEVRREGLTNKKKEKKKERTTRQKDEKKEHAPVCANTSGAI